MEDRDSRYEELIKQYDLEGRAQEILQTPLYEQPAPVLKSPAEEARLPEPVCLADIWQDPPELAPQLIEGVLRQGHKMIISAPSKAGKSFLLMELAFAIAEGMNWLGSRCKKGRVLYINMEIDPASVYSRFRAVYDGFGMGNSQNVDNITVWNLRGKTVPLSKLAPSVIKVAGKVYSAIIIDPLYKVMKGDENSNRDVADMVAYFDTIAQETGASVIYAHHFAKGVGGDRDAIDRGAGAGTFARDPDAILTMVQLDINDPTDAASSAWRMEYVLREFPNKAPVSFWWKYPVHHINDALDDIQIITSQTKKQNALDESVKRRRKERIEKTTEVAGRLEREKGLFTAGEFARAYAEYVGADKLPAPNSAKGWLQEAGYVSLPAPKNGLPAYWKREE